MKGHTKVWELLDCTDDAWVTHNGKKVEMGNTVAGIGIVNHDTLRCCGRLRGSAQRFRQRPPDIRGQWTCRGVVDKKGCGLLKIFASGAGAQKVTNRNLLKPTACSSGWYDAKFPSLAQPLPAGAVDASASGSVHPFPVGCIDWRTAFLQQIMSPSPLLSPLLRKSKFRLQCKLTTKTKERCTDMGRIEHYRNCCREMEVKLAKHSELLAVARKSALQDEINEIEARIAAAEPPVLPDPPAPDVQVTFPPSSC